MNTVWDKVWMTVPTGTRHTYLPALVAGCGLPLDRIVIVNTTPATAPIPGVRHLTDLGALNIHRWWNDGIAVAEGEGATRVLVANDDVEFGLDLIPALDKALTETGAAIAYPGDPEGSKIEGSCYLLDLLSGVRPDERFRWWYGDNDMARRGKVVRVPVPFKHHHPNETTNTSKALQALVLADHAAYVAKWAL